jgi:hypothetical protein
VFARSDIWKEICGGSPARQAREGAVLLENGWDYAKNSCSEALAEAAALTGQAEAIVKMVRDGDIVLDFSLAAEADAVLALLERYKDRQIDLADACIVRLS